MEGTPPLSAAARKIIVDVWVRQGGVALGEAELGEIQGELRRQLGAAAEAGPAGIARVLADEGAELRHPEVIEFDARWREAQIENENAQFKGFDELLGAKPVSLKKAGALIAKLEKLRNSGDQPAGQARELAIIARQNLQRLSRDEALGSQQRDEQAEIVEWLKVWIQTPSLFSDWLELRRRSTEFQKRFAARDTAS
jgi:hypothetical protein